MRLLRDPDRLSPSVPPLALAIGNFEGFHLGHQAVVAAMRAVANEQQLTPSVMLFSPHPRRFFAKDALPLRIETFRTKALRLCRAGVGLLIVKRFTAALATMKPQEFVEDILLERLRVRELVTGEDFRFGQGREGTSDLLRDYARRGVLGYQAIPAYRGESGIFSSTALREALRQGDMERAHRILGRPYETEGRVVHGDSRGAGLGTPTANLRLPDLCEPRRGVYAVRFRREEEDRWQEGVANFGLRPTFGGQEPLLEVHGFLPAGNLYGARLVVQWLCFLRDERRFDDAQALKQQINADILQARSYLQGAWR